MGIIFSDFGIVDYDVFMIFLDTGGGKTSDKFVYRNRVKPGCDNLALLQPGAQLFLVLRVQ
jgi:hypothetical protein